VQCGSTRSWFEVTEEDDNNFLGNKLISAGVRAEVVVARTAWVNLPSDSWAHIFLFTDVAAVGRSSAACSVFRSCLWDDQLFWASYGGSSFEVLATPALTRSAFRRWVHGLEGAWATAFAVETSVRHCADVFSDATYMLCGLQASNEDLEQAKAFVAILASRLAVFDADCSKTLRRARETVARAFECRSLLPPGAAFAMQEALDTSVQRAHAERTDNTYWRSAEEMEANSEDKVTKSAMRPVPAIDTAASASMARAALAVLGGRHRGLDTAAAQRSL